MTEPRKGPRERGNTSAIAKEAPYIAEIAPIDESAPLTVYQIYTSGDNPNQFCVMIDGDLKPLSDLQGKYTVITSLKPGASAPDTSGISPIKLMRENCRLTQKQLADLIGCRQKDISRYETGDRRPGADTMERLSRVLGCTMDELMILLRHFKQANKKSPD